MSQSVPLLSIIVPAFNEERRLPPSLENIISFLRAQDYESEILVVTDGSSDKTAEVARGFIAKFPQLRVIEFAENRGKGFSVREGMSAARGEYRVFMDADYAVPVEYCTSFLEKMRKENLDILIGSRTADGAHVERRQPFLRQQLASLFAVAQRAVLKIPYKDTQCGFKMFTADAAHRYFPLLHYDCAYFDAELLYLAYWQQARIGECGVIWRHDSETRLPIDAKRIAELIKKLFMIQWLHPKSESVTV